jgi:hypothetical protein
MPAAHEPRLWVFPHVIADFQDPISMKEVKE